MTIALIVIFVLLFINGVLAASELAVVSARRSRLQALEKKGSRRARAALKLAEDPTRFLSTVQVGITLVGILLGALGEDNFAAPLADSIRKVPLLAPHAHLMSVVLVAAGLTILSVIVGELIPKRLALQFPEQVAIAMSRPMRLLATITGPLVEFLSGITDFVLGLFGITRPPGPSITVDEVKAILEQGRHAGVFEALEHDMVKNVLRLDDRRVSGMMTPRRDIVWIDTESSPEDVLEKLGAGNHTRFPVGQGSIDNIVGIVRARDMLSQVLSGRNLHIPGAMTQPLFVPENMTALELLEALKSHSTHVAVVFDEYGGTQGLVTLNDVLAAIVGEVPKPGDLPETEVARRGDGSYLLGGTMPIEQFLDIFGLDELSEADRGNFTTLGGFVMTHMGRVPKAADSFEWNNLRIEVVDMDGNRVDKVLVAAMAPTPGDEDEGAGSGD